MQRFRRLIAPLLAGLAVFVIAGCDDDDDDIFDPGDSLSPCAFEAGTGNLACFVGDTLVISTELDEDEGDVQVVEVSTGTNITLGEAERKGRNFFVVRLPEERFPVGVTRCLSFRNSDRFITLNPFAAAGEAQFFLGDPAQGFCLAVHRDAEGEFRLGRATTVVTPTITVTVRPVNDQMVVGSTFQLVVETTGECGIVQFESSAAAVLTVSPTGLLTAVSAGTATIRVFCPGTDVSVTITITVVAVPPPTDTSFFLQIAPDGRSFSFAERVFGHLTPRPTPVAVVGDFNGWVSSGVNSSLISGRYVVRFSDFGTQFAIGSCTKLNLFAPSLPVSQNPWAQWGSEVDQLAARNPNDPRLQWFFREQNGGWALQVTRLTQETGALGCVSGPQVSLSITNEPAQLMVGQTFQLAFQVTGSANQSVSCVTSNESVLRTTDAGFLQGMGVGTATITCVAAADNAAKDSVTISVVLGSAPCTFIANVHCVDSAGDLWFEGSLAGGNTIQVVGWNNDFTTGPNAARQANGHFRLLPAQVNVPAGAVQCISMRTTSGFIDITSRVRNSGRESSFCGSETQGFSPRVRKTADGRFTM